MTQEEFLPQPTIITEATVTQLTDDSVLKYFLLPFNNCESSGKLDDIFGKSKF